MTTPADMTGPELDAAVAREVMGWVRGRGFGDHEGWYDPGDGVTTLARIQRDMPWSPSTDYAAAFEVVDRVRTDRSRFMRFWHALVHATTARRRALGESDAVRMVCGDAPVLYYLHPRAICEAVLAAVREGR